MHRSRLGSTSTLSRSLLLEGIVTHKVGMELGLSINCFLPAATSVQGSQLCIGAPFTPRNASNPNVSLNMDSTDKQHLLLIGKAHKTWGFAAVLCIPIFEMRVHNRMDDRDCFHKLIDFDADTVL